MTISPIYIAALLVVMNATGQLLLKRATQTGGFRSVELWLGYGAFLFTVSVSFVLMHVIELKYFTVIMSLNYVVVMIASAYFFKENLSWTKVLGTMVVLAGIIVFLGGI